MSYVVMRKKHDSRDYILVSEPDTIADAVDARERALVNGGQVEIFQRVHTLDAYAEAARQRSKAPVYPAPDAAFSVPIPAMTVMPAKSRFEQELDKFEAHEVKG